MPLPADFSTRIRRFAIEEEKKTPFLAWNERLVITVSIQRRRTLAITDKVITAQLWEEILSTEFEEPEEIEIFKALHNNENTPIKQCVAAALIQRQYFGRGMVRKLNRILKQADLPVQLGWTPHKSTTSRMIKLFMVE